MEEVTRLVFYSEPSKILLLGRNMLLAQSSLSPLPHRLLRLAIFLIVSSLNIFARPSVDTLETTVRVKSILPVS